MKELRQKFLNLSALLSRRRGKKDLEELILSENAHFSELKENLPRNRRTRLEDLFSEIVTHNYGIRNVNHKQDYNYTFCCGEDRFELFEELIKEDRLPEFLVDNATYRDEVVEYSASALLLFDVIDFNVNNIKIGYETVQFPAFTIRERLLHQANYEVADRGLIHNNIYSIRRDRLAETRDSENNYTRLDEYLTRISYFHRVFDENGPDLQSNNVESASYLFYKMWETVDDYMKFFKQKPSFFMDLQDITLNNAAYWYNKEGINPGKEAILNPLEHPEKKYIIEFSKIINRQS